MINAETPGHAVAQWWAEQLGAPTFNNGDGLTSLLASALNGNPGPLSPAQVDLFVEDLAVRVNDSLAVRESYNEGLPRVPLGTDYHPDRELAEAAEGAGIPASRFPWKTMTWTTPDYVTVSLGYGAPTTLTWSRPGWERGLCEQRRYTDDWMQQLPEVCGLERFHEERECGSWIPREVTK